MRIDALTIVRGRELHLANQLRGWSLSDRKPDRWIVIGMDQDVRLPRLVSGIKVITDRVDSEGETLPLARARNRAADLSDGDAMLFLDVDCIPSPKMVTSFDHALLEDDRLWMGSPRYLPKHATKDGWSMTTLGRLGVPHPVQPRIQPDGRITSSSYELFWSLCFAITKNAWNRIGGFNEAFEGYGAEDTDFAFAAREAGVSLGFVDAVAYHQHHPVCKPPLNHFDAIVRNAIQFRRRWGIWPMESWLRAFEDLELIRFESRTNVLHVLRHPSEEQVQQAVVETPAGF